ncbi:MAG: LytTR family DNA-binding domain-containing protein [Nonlabens sp.]
MEKVILSCYLVDPSLTQRVDSSKLIENHPDLQLKKQFTTIEDAIKSSRLAPVDLVICEAEVVDKTVFEYINSLEDRPFIIIAANSRAYAFKAYEYNVIDYLSKPLKKERFELAIEKVLRAHRLKEEIVKSKGEFIFVKCNLKKRKVYLNELLYIEALGDYVKLITTKESLVVLSTMKAFEQTLPYGRFLRIHKSYIVNLTRIEKFNSREVELEQLKLPLSRKRKVELKEVLAQQTSF